MLRVLDIPMRILAGRGVMLTVMGEDTEVW